MRYHIFKEHLVEKEQLTGDENDETVVRSVIEQMLDRVDGQPPKAMVTFDQYLFRCNQCTSGAAATFKCKSQLNKHVQCAHAESLSRLKCVYCSKLFEMKSIGDYLAHLKTNHKQFIINDLLLNKRSFSQTKFDPCIDWSEYFASDLIDEHARTETTSGYL